MVVSVIDACHSSTQNPRGRSRGFCVLAVWTISRRCSVSADQTRWVPVVVLAGQGGSAPAGTRQPVFAVLLAGLPSLAGIAVSVPLAIQLHSAPSSRSPVPTRAQVAQQSNLAHRPAFDTIQVMPG